MKDAYDVVVVGAGMGGLTCAALLAKAGMSVLVVEQHSRPGGYVQSFCRQSFIFDAAVHLTSGCGKSGMIYSLLQELGMQDQIEFLPVSPMYKAFYPEYCTNVYANKKDFIEAHTAIFPHEKYNIEALMKVMEKLNRELWAGLDTQDTQNIRSRSYPYLARYRHLTFGQMLDEFLTDNRLKSVISALCVYLGLPPSRISALSMVGMLMSYLEGGAYYVKGGFNNLVRVFIKALGKYQADLLLNNKVNKIVVKNNRVCAVELGNGTQIKTSYVISNADAKQTFFYLIGRNKIRKDFLRTLDNMAPSISAFEIFWGVDLALNSKDFCHEMLVYDTYDFDYIFNQLRYGNPQGLAICIPTLTDSSLAVNGKHCISLTTLVDYDPGYEWSSFRQVLRDRMVKIATRILTDITKHIEVEVLATPLTMYRYTLNSRGAIYGWEHSVNQVWQKRLAAQTPISNLYLVGHWTTPGGGILNVMISGYLVANSIVKRNKKIGLKI